MSIEAQAQTLFDQVINLIHDLTERNEELEGIVEEKNEEISNLQAKTEQQQDEIEALRAEIADLKGGLQDA